MALETFTQALAGAKRRANLQGRPITRRETAGITAGYAAEAGNRAMQGEALRQNQEQFAATMQQRREENLAQMKAAEDARKDQARQQGAVMGGVGGYFAGQALGGLLGGGAAGMSAGTALSLAGGTSAMTAVGGGVAGGGGLGATLGAAAGPIGIVVGGLLGALLGDSYLCTQTNRQAGLDRSEVEDLHAFRRYAERHHNEWLRWYLGIGPALVERIRWETAEARFYENIRETMIRPVCRLTRGGRPEAAFQIYRRMAVRFCGRWAPGLLAFAPHDERRAA